MTSAALRKPPLLVCVQDNDYAISAPVEAQTAGGNISKLVASFPNFQFDEFDGTDVLASFAALHRAIDHIRTGQGPAFLHGHVTRPYSHSLSDDEKLYRSAAELKDEVARDPLAKHRRFLIQEEILNEAGVHAIEKEVDKEIQIAADRALVAPLPKLESITQCVYSPHLDPQ